MFDWPDILAFWFGAIDNQGLPDPDCRRRWFRVDKQFDYEMRRRFLSMLLIASENGLSHWRAQPGGALAELLLLDQFSRNVYRGTSLAFQQDAMARKLAYAMLEKAVDTRLQVMERCFAYMPLQHSERVSDQQESVALYGQLQALAQEPVKSIVASFNASAQKHHAIIAQFGRFPHRNQILGRRSSPEEVAFLTSNDTSYGQQQTP